MKRKRIKKYQGGGFTPGTGFTGTNVGKGIGAFGGMAGGLIENADMADGRMSTTGALGSGALKGASMGMAFGPVGALLGAGIGMAGGLMKRDQVNAAEDDRLQAERDAERLRANMENQMKHQQMNQVLDQFPVKGNNTPRFAMGGPTGGGFDTNRMMVPTYAQGAGADAMPSFDFYADGQQVSAQDYIAGLPQGQSINDHSQYWTSTLQPRFDQATQTWSNTGQGPMAQSAYGAMQKHAPKFAMGGDTDPVHGTAWSFEELAARHANADMHGTIRQWTPSRWDLFKEAMHNHNMKDDSTFENGVEIIDPTGVSSWDDAYRAGVNRNERGGAHNADEMLDIAGAMPIFGKFKAGLNLGKSASKKLAHSFKSTAEKGWAAAKRASNALNVVDGVEDEVGFMDEYAMGGLTGNPTGGGGTDPYANISNDKRAMLRAASVHPKANEFAGANPELMNALGSMPYDQFNTLKDSASNIKSQAKALKGQGIGATLDFVRGLDISSLKPLREGANMSKDELLDAVLGQSGLGWATRKAAKLALNSKEFKMGGSTMGPGYEVEGGEMMQTKGETPQTYGQGGMSQVASQEYEVQGPKHSNGGVKANDNQGARVYSDKLRVDDALLSKLSKL